MIFYYLFIILFYLLILFRQTNLSYSAVPVMNDLFGINFNWWVRNDVYGCIYFIMEKRDGGRGEGEEKGSPGPRGREEMREETGRERGGARRDGKKGEIMLNNI